MIADVIVIAIVALSAYMGYKKGFVRTVSKLCCLIVSIIVAKILRPYVGEFVRQSFIGEYINEKFAETSSEIMGSNMPLFLKEAGEYTANSVTDAVVGVITVLLIIVITYLLAHFIVNALNIVAKLPVISFVNRLMGVCAGFLMGVFVVYLVMSIFVMADVSGTEKWFLDSVVAYTMYNDNVLMNLIF